MTNKEARYIDADKAIEYFEKHRRIAIHKDDIVAYLADLPTADVQEVKHGEWKFGYSGYFDCSNCGFAYDTECERYLMAFPDGVKELKYCPHCGAKMDG